MNGRRFPDGEYDIEPGGYSKHIVGDETHWWICTPNGCKGMLSLHAVVENEDGTITVDERPAPPDDPSNRNSILVHGSGDRPGWHGYIDAGVWREI